jgi:hypothetical protein
MESVKDILSRRQGDTFFTNIGDASSIAVATKAGRSIAAFPYHINRAVVDQVYHRHSWRHNEKR